MSKMIQVRNVPGWLHKELVRRAKSRNQTLTQYVQDVLEREVSRPPSDEVFARIRGRRRVRLDRPVGEIIREQRERRHPS
jgi:hypothetical protein